MKGFGEKTTSKRETIPKNQQIINSDKFIKKAFELQVQGKKLEAAKYYQYCINQDLKDHRIFCNYAGILQEIGKLKEAEALLNKAVKIKPDYAAAYFNLGIILKNLGRLEEAESAYRKALKIEPEYAEAYCNLGIILKNLGRLEEAELSYRKALDIKNDYAEVHSNLGIVLRWLGKLNKAESSFREAIQLIPELGEAHSNLGSILRDLGKFEELILLSHSTLESKSINLGYKLLATVRLTITNLILGDFSGILLNIKRTKKFITKGATNTIKDEKNEKHALSYYSFINSLYPLLEKEKSIPNLDKIPHFGESHCLSFAHQNLFISSKKIKIQPVLIVGGKAWHFANNKNNQWKESLTQQMKSHAYSDKVFISFGEIDCRKDEGILPYSIHNKKNISKVCEKTIVNYLDYMEEVLSRNYSERYYFGIPAPLREKAILDELDKKRIRLVKFYNKFLKQSVLSRGSFFVDVYALTSTNKGENNNLHMCDQVHLSPKCLSILFTNYLIKPDI